jgi:adenine-specific DNA methylase
MQLFNQGQSLPARWEFAEMSPCIDSGSGWSTSVEYSLKVFEHVASIAISGQVVRASAMSHPLPSDSVDVFVTDPPYYSAIPYADLSDFFFVWLKRSLVGLHAELLEPKVTEKKDELVALAHRAAMYREKDSAWFEKQMGAACAEGRRICKASGLGVVVFANKETTAWEAMLAALIEAGWVVTASWPIDTESTNRLRAKESAALASSVHLVCRPRVKEDPGDWRDVLSELPQRMHDWMPRLASEGVIGADAIFACLGPALEIFSRYSRVEKANGDAVLLKEFLEHVWAAVSKEALSTIFRDADASGLEPDARLTAMWLWTIGGAAPMANGKPADDGEADYEGPEEEDEGNSKAATASGFTLEFDAARKIAQGLGIHLERSESFVEVKGEKARLLPVAERTKHLFGKEAETGPAGRKKAKNKVKQRSLFEELDEAEDAGGGWKELKGPPPGATILDRLHQAMILFGAQRGELLKRFLVEDGVGKDARFWKLAQSLAALYPPGTDERRWVEGVLARKKGLGL